MRVSCLISVALRMGSVFHIQVCVLQIGKYLWLVVK